MHVDDVLVAKVTIENQFERCDHATITDPRSKVDRTSLNISYEQV
jgi:hypothetical protein